MAPKLNPPLVSVVITSYNYARFIEDALESVSRQTYRPLECIVIDDCSTDNSVEVTEAFFAKKRSQNDGVNYSLYSTGKNSGQLAAFQLGIKKSAGVFINFLDADDFLFPDFVSTHVQVHMEHLVAFTFNEPVEIDADNQVRSFTSNSGDVYQHLDLQRQNYHTVPFDQYHNCLDTFTIPSIRPETIYPLVAFDNFKWLWYPTTSTFFRKAAITSICNVKDVDSWRICADNLLLNYAALRSDSCFVAKRLNAYRRHGKNAFAPDEISGKKRSFTNQTLTQMSVMVNLCPKTIIELLAEEYKDNSTLKRWEIQDLCYQTGFDFVWKHKEFIFEKLGFSSKLSQIKLLLKTIIRNHQFKIKQKHATNKRSHK